MEVIGCGLGRFDVGVTGNKLEEKVAGLCFLGSFDPWVDCHQGQDLEVFLMTCKWKGSCLGCLAL